MKKRFLGVTIVGIMVLGLTSCGGSSNVSNSTTAATTVEATEAEVTEKETTEAEEVEENTATSNLSFSDNVAVLDDYTIKITEYKVIPVGEPGNEYGKTPVIAFWYDTTNTSGKELDPITAFISVMTAVQDNDPNAVNELSVGLLPDSQFSESQMKKIKKDGTVSNAISYELSDTETPVDLTCKNGMFGEEIGTITYDVK